MTERQAYWLGIIAFLVVYLGLAYMLEYDKMQNLLAFLGAFQFGRIGHWVWYEIVGPYIVKSKLEQTS